MRTNGTRVAPAATAAILLAQIYLPVTGRAAFGPAPLECATAADEGSRAAATFDALPLVFEKNVGQTDERVEFVARGRGYAAFVSGSAVALAVHAAPRVLGHEPESGASAEPGRTSGHAVFLEVVGARDAVSARGERELASMSSHFRGSDPDGWVSGVPHFERVVCEEVYPGVDLALHGTQKQLEYDFVVAPGADPGRIAVRFDGADSMSVDEDGSLVLGVGGGELRQLPAVAYQEGAAGKRAVEARYALRDGAVGFELGAFDPSVPLVIDPVLVFSTYLGGAASTQPGAELARAVAVDAAGSAYVAGETFSVDFPVTPGAVDVTVSGGDAFVAKLSPSGSSIVFAFYLGGRARDAARAVAVDGAGAVYVAGTTYADQPFDLPSDFPTTPGAVDETFDNKYDAFVAKVDPTGSTLVYSTLLGGVHDDVAEGIAVDAAGSACVAGRTASPEFPTTPGALDTQVFGSDCFVTKLNPTGTGLVFSTFLGGSGYDEAKGVAIDGAGDVHVAGATEPGVASQPFPTTVGSLDTTPNGLSDAFILKLSAEGSELRYSTLLGGASLEGARSIAVDAAGAAFVCGSTLSADFPTTSGAHDVAHSGLVDGFVAKISAGGDSLVFSTLYGVAVYPNDIAVDAAGAAHFAGSTTGSVPVTPGALDSVRGSGDEGFVAKLSADGSALVYSTYLGGTSEDAAHAIAVTPAGLACVVGETRSLTGFPSTSASFDSTQNGDSDAFAVQLSASGTALVYGGFLGGRAASHSEVANAVAVDAAGAIYVAGRTTSIEFPATPGAYDTTSDANGAGDVFVAKLSASGGRLVYATYLGGDYDDAGHAVAVDDAGAAYVAGATTSSNFPTTEGAYDTSGGLRDGFVAKLDATGGSLVYSTFVGGASDDSVASIAVDSAGSAYVAGATNSSDFPTTPDAFDTSNEPRSTVAFVSRLDPAGASLVFSTFLGGGTTRASGVAVDAGGVVVAGTTYSDFPTTPGAFDTTFNGGVNSTDAFVTRLSSTGTSLVFSTFAGGTSDDSIRGVALDAAGAIYVTGVTRSFDYPTTAGAYLTTSGPRENAFVTKLEPTGSALAYSTFLHGFGFADDGATSIAVTASGAAVLTGYTNDVHFPVTPGAVGPTFNSRDLFYDDAFVAQVSPTGSGLQYSTFLGGLFGDRGAAVAAGPGGTIYVAGFSESPDFLTSSAMQPEMRGAGDAFVTVLSAVGAGDGIGVHSAATGAWFLRNANSGGVADLTFFYGSGGGGLVALAGDWDGDGTDTPGLYDPATGAFFLRDSSTPGPADSLFFYGPGGAGISPLVGDWDGDGVDTVGVYGAATGAFFLRNSNAGGAADLVFFFGAGGSGVVPIVGDWDGDGADSVGLHVVTTGAFFLRNANAGGSADLVFFYGGAGATAITGDWDGDGTDTVGIYAPAAGAWFLSNENAGGAADLTFFYGGPNATPLAGNWDGQ